EDERHQVAGGQGRDVVGAFREVEAGFDGGLGDDRREVARDEKHDAHHDGAADQRAEEIAPVDRRRHGDEEGGGGQVADRHRRVAGQDEDDQMRDGKEQDADRDRVRVAQRDGRVEPAVELRAFEQFFEERLGRVGNRNEAFHDDLHHARQQHHQGGHGDDELARRLQVVPDRNPHQDAEDEADHDRFADEFQLFLDERRVDFDPVHAGDFVIDFVQQQI